MNADDKHIMKVAEVAAFLQVSPETVLRLTKKGDIPSCKIGKQWRFRREDIEKLWEDKK